MTPFSRARSTGAWLRDSSTRTADPRLATVLSGKAARSAHEPVLLAAPAARTPSSTRSIAFVSASASGGRRSSRWRKALLISVLAVALLATFLAVQYASLPGVGDAERRVSRVLQAHGAQDDHTVPSRLGEAVVAVEDERFYRHGPLDLEGLARALVTSVSRRGVDPGGSTLTQQLAKVLYADSAGGWSARVREIGLAFELERRYSKRQILEMYVNAVYFGGGYYGIQQAAEGYFGTSPDRLSWAQASLLAGLPQAPSLYDPRHDLAAARRRQGHVLDRLVANRRLTAAQARRIFARIPALRRPGT